MALITIKKCTQQILIKQNQYYNIFKYNNNNNIKLIKTSNYIYNNNKTIPFKLSDIGEGIREVVIKEWFIKEGQQISQFDNICEVQSDKASVTITSRYDGIVHKICHHIDDIVLVGDTLIQINTNNNDTTDKSLSLSSSSYTSLEDNNNNNKHHVLTIPAVRKLAKDQNINLKNIKGTGKDGRILKEDISINKDIQKIENGLDKERNNNNKIIPIKGYRKAMFKNMSESMKIPHFVYSDEIKLTNLIKLRNDIKKLNNNKIIINKLTYMPFMIKAISLSLLEYPILNSMISNDETEIILKSSHNIGVAMDTKDGLVVPNIKNCEMKTILEITKELLRLQECAQILKFNKYDLLDHTFTFSNIGTIGGTYTHPIILYPNVIIGAIGRIQILPRFIDNHQIISEHILQVSWSADHRIIDGVTLAKFSNLWKYYIENPNILLIN